MNLKGFIKIFRIERERDIYPNNLKSRPRDGIESCRKSTTAGFVNDSVLVNTGSFTIVDFRRFEPVPWPTFEVVWVYTTISTLLHQNDEYIGLGRTQYEGAFLLSNQQT